LATGREPVKEAGIDSERLEKSAMMPRQAHSALLLTMLALAGCSNVKPNPTAPGAIIDPSRQAAGGSILGDDGLAGLFGTQRNKDQGGSLGVNAYLWRGALDTLSFMPLVSADPFGGVIITDWYTPAGVSGERFKATAYILGKELRSDGIRVSLFRQVLQGGQWVDTQVSKVTVGEMEDKVLTRARKLREQGQAAG